jgi:hypothetical protein
MAEQKNNLKAVLQWITLHNDQSLQVSLCELFFDVMQQPVQHRRIPLWQNAQPLVQPIAQFLVIADPQRAQ